MSDADQTISCKDCKADFVFTASDQQFFADKGFQPPKRCRACRNLRKTQNQQGADLAAPPVPDEYRPQRERHRKGGRRDNY